MGVGLFRLFAGLLFGGLSRVIRQPIVKVNYLVTDTPRASSVGVKLEQHFGSSHVATQRVFGERPDGQFLSRVLLGRPPSRYSAGAERTSLITSPIVLALRFGRPRGLPDAPALKRECLGGFA